MLNHDVRGVGLIMKNEWGHKFGQAGLPAGARCYMTRLRGDGVFSPDSTVSKKNVTFRYLMTSFGNGVSKINFISLKTKLK